MASTTQEERELAYAVWKRLQDLNDGGQVDLSPLYALFPGLKRGYVRRMVDLEKKKEIRGEAEGEEDGDGEEPHGEPEQIRYDVDGNYLDVSGLNLPGIPYDHVANAYSVKNLQDLIKAINPDLTVWRPGDDWEARTWPTTGKDKNSGRPWSVRNYYVKAKFIRIEPQSIYPSIQPVEIVSAFALPPAPAGEGIGTALVISDPHFGFFYKDVHARRLLPMHDRRALDVALQVAFHLQPDIVVFSGDLQDLADWSTKFIRSPEFYWCTQPAVIENAWWLAQFRQAVPGARIVAMEGNHGKRMRDALITHLNAAYELRAADEISLPPALSLPRLLALDSIGVEYIGDYPDGELDLDQTTAVIHGRLARKDPAATVKALVASSDRTMIQGHIHRIEVAGRTAHLGNGRRALLLAYSPGATCHVDGRVPGTSKKLNWQQGIGVVRYDRGGGRLPAPSITPLPIHEGMTVLDGRVIEARDRLPDLIDDTKWEFQPDEV